MYSPTDLKKGTIIQIDGEPYRVIDYAQKVMGRGGSIVNVKVKNLITEAVCQRPTKVKKESKLLTCQLKPRSIYTAMVGDCFL